ncbi:hypothetical protein HanXRQr2_Chr02g0057301 [Helianthus annuus]|uniref:Uncharacterized protein n=1 Tax=Helianthus annuus TaxID=4232 RepID=A0A9K3NZ10_HELAN|nr:hypothetical protein HanXRQr2_Chr02g0057301 [Helianthus annuus]KAJ0951162.1 hypothetical protein HanPSC8_Chr02g0056721 [Helianthus annuus]
MFGRPDLWIQFLNLNSIYSSQETHLHMASSFLYHPVKTLISTPASSTTILLFHSDIQNTQSRS